MPFLEPIDLTQRAKLWLASVLLLWESRKQHVSLLYSVFNTVGVVFIINVFVYLWLFESPWMTYDAKPFRMITPVVRAGDDVSFIVNRCSDAASDRIYLIAKEIHGRNLKEPIMVRADAARIKPGCHSGLGQPVTVPKEIARNVPLPPDFYWVEGFAEIPGYIKTNTVRFRTAEFEVVPSSP